MKKKVIIIGSGCFLIVLVVLVLISFLLNTRSIKSIGSRGNIEYEIMESTQYDCDNYSRGYTVKSLDNAYLITIAMGGQGTGGYDIAISDITNKNGNMTITVKETTPKESDVVTMAITCPKVSVKLNILPNNLTVMNTNKETFNKTELNN